MLRISWTEYNTNVWVRQKIGVPVSRFECVSGLSVYPVEIRSLSVKTARRIIVNQYENGYG